MSASIRRSAPLQGITVVSLEQAVAAPLATRHLADLGARVIKIERPGVGDFARAYDTTVKGLASHFVWLNRSKESLTLDLKRDEAKSILRRLIATCDVFVHNLAPGAVDRLGFSASSLRSGDPRLIVCQITGYGASGPLKDKKAYDLLIQAEAGLVSITGSEDAPAKVAISVADIAAGMYAYSGILSALFARERGGEGAALEISLLEALTEWMGYPIYYAAYGRVAPRRSGARHATIAPYGPFEAADGRIVYVAVQNEREWKRFCEVVLELPAVADDPRFASNSRRVEHRGDLESVIAKRLDGLTAEELRRRLDLAGIANAPMNTVEQLLDHPQLASRERWRQVASPVGPLRALVPPVTADTFEPVMGPIPDVGQHTLQILRNLGYDEALIDSWKSQGVI